MNRLKREKQEMVLSLLVEGNSIRSIERITEAHRDTIMRLLVRIGNRCQKEMDRKMRGLTSDAIECDEIWTFLFKKQARLTPEEKGTDKGDQYVFVALDQKTKLVPVFIVGKRNAVTTMTFIQELRKRVVNHFQLSTDKFKPYPDIVDSVFGTEIDYATVKKIYHGDRNGKREGYSPSELRKVEISTIIGKPKREKICTSYVERHNLTIRMQLRRFTRLTNAFSKKLENLKAAMALYFYHYNFMRIHSTLRVTPAMEAGITNRIWTWEPVLN